MSLVSLEFNYANFVGTCLFEASFYLLVLLFLWLFMIVMYDFLLFELMKTFYMNFYIAYFRPSLVGGHFFKFCPGPNNTQNGPAQEMQLRENLHPQM